MWLGQDTPGLFSSRVHLGVFSVCKSFSSTGFASLSAKSWWCPGCRRRNQFSTMQHFWNHTWSLQCEIPCEHILGQCWKKCSHLIYPLSPFHAFNLSLCYLCLHLFMTAIVIILYKFGNFFVLCTAFILFKITPLTPEKLPRQNCRRPWEFWFIYYYSY